MGTATVVFLVIGGIGVAVLGLALLGTELLSFGHPDVNGPVSLEAVAGFVGAFGFAAAICSEVFGSGTTGAVAVASGVGLGAAIPTAILAMRLARAARTMPTDPTPTRDDLIGTMGSVVTPIPVNGFGEVLVRLAGQPVKLNARSDTAVPMGAQIFVVQTLSDTSVVVEQAQRLTP